MRRSMVLVVALLACGGEKDECKAVISAAQDQSMGAKACANTSRGKDDVDGIVSDMNDSAAKYEAGAKAVRAVKTSSPTVTEARDKLAAAMDNKAKACRAIGEGVKKRGTWFGMQPEETKREFQPWTDAEADFEKPHSELLTCAGFK